MPTTETFANCTTCCQSELACCISEFTQLTMQWAGLTLTLPKQIDGSFFVFLTGASGTYGNCQGTVRLTCSAGRYQLAISITIPITGQTCSVPCIFMRFETAGALATSCEPFLLTARVYCDVSGIDTGLDATITE